MATTTPPHKHMRSNTLLSIAEAIKEGGAMSKRDIQDKTGLSWGSCNEAINLLVNEGLLNAYKVDGNAAGRKLTKYRFTNDQYLACGMEIQKQSIICSLANFGMKELFHEKFDIKSPFSKANFFNSILNVFNKFLKRNGVGREHLLSLTISLTGAVDIISERLVYSPRYPNIANLDFGPLKKLLAPTKYFFVEHDIKGQTSSIIKKYKWKEENFVFLHFGEGVGMSIYNRGFESGFNGFAGEIGHLPFHVSLKKDRSCSCGRVNCYETLLSKTGVNDLLDAYNNDHEAVSNLIAQGVSEIVVMIANIINPQAVFYGGDAIEPFLGDIDSVIKQSVQNQAWQGGVEIIRSYSAHDINCAYGAILNSSSLITERYISDHLI